MSITLSSQIFNEFSQLQNDLLTRIQILIGYEPNTVKRQVFHYQDVAKLYNINKGPHISIPKKAGGVLVGRSSSCDIKLTGSDVSSKHCQLSFAIQPREKLFITDLSSNGTIVNDEPLGRGNSKILRSGDKICFAKTGGTYIFRYAIDIENDQSFLKKRSFFDDYTMGNQLGSGHYAVVKEARNRTTGDIVAVKIFHPAKTGDDKSNYNEDEKLKQEMNLLLSINHPNIVKFINHYVEPVNQYLSTNYLVLEKVNSGELFQRIVNKLKLRQDETKAIFKQLLTGLKYLHDKNIIHRDIKPENILLDIEPKTAIGQMALGPWDDHEYDIKVKIADFGLAKFIGEVKFTNTLCGTPAYVAPEVLENKSEYSTKVDLWLSGVLLYVCLCGFPPFSDELAPPNLREQILSAKYAFYSPYWDDISDSALDLISSLLLVDPNDRFDVGQTLNHYWFSEAAVREIVPTDSLPMLIEDRSGGSSITRSSLNSQQPITLRQRYTTGINVMNID